MDDEKMTLYSCQWGKGANQLSWASVDFAILRSDGNSRNKSAKKGVELNWIK